ncbi:MAG: hypothetical protein INH41_20370 [Myxococcaceae bacterium]|jgi:hypothetical protein|nr:hypothetical protein [Myxococcaceae bacterium]MCA3014745.1 hypothetical protein [Myxococcaceae bacterium]
MSERLPPLHEALRAVFDTATPPQPSAEFEARVLERVTATLAGVALPEDTSGSGGFSGPTGAPTPDGVPAPGVVVVKKGVLALGAALLLGGGGLGGVLVGRVVLTPPAAEVKASPGGARAKGSDEALGSAHDPADERPAAGVQRPSGATASVGGAGSMPAKAAGAPNEVSAAPPGPKAPQPSASVQGLADAGGAPAGHEDASRDTALSAERALLEVARTALARGDVGATLAAVERHEREFPGGRLLEEREVLFVQALALSGRRGDAAARQAAFKTRFPDSLSLPAVDAALAP